MRRRGRRRQGRWRVLSSTFAWPHGRAQEQVAGWVPHWEMRGGMLCSFPKREAKNTGWWPLTFRVSHQLSVLGRRAMPKGESHLVQAIHYGSLLVGHEQLVLIPSF